MTKKKSEVPYWGAFVYCYNPDVNKILGSFISFWARNKFEALNALRDHLPANPDYLDASGELRPYTLLDLRQIKPEESAEWAELFMSFFSNEFGGYESSRVTLSA